MAINKTIYSFAQVYFELHILFFTQLHSQSTEREREREYIQVQGCQVHNIKTAKLQPQMSPCNYVQYIILISVALLFEVFRHVVYFVLFCKDL